MNWLFPLANMRKLGATSDSMSFQKINWLRECEIPVLVQKFDDKGRQHHYGAFGAQRTHDVHKGVDLYCPEGTPVIAAESGIVVHIRPFTGLIAGYPWWEDTHAISVVGATGLIVYAELHPEYHLRVGDSVERGDTLGWVKRVLKSTPEKLPLAINDRPASMLHLELHEHNVKQTGQWEKATKKMPRGLLDPTPYLLKSFCDGTNEVPPPRTY